MPSISSGLASRSRLNRGASSGMVAIFTDEPLSSPVSSMGSTGSSPTGFGGELGQTLRRGTVFAQGGDGHGHAVGPVAVVDGARQVDPLPAAERVLERHRHDL